MIEEWRGYLTGFENNSQVGGGYRFNFIMSNGDRSAQRDEGVTYYDHLMPAGSHKRIRSVKIYHNRRWITGFEFLDKNKKLLCEIGYTKMHAETVKLEENEMIVGVVFKLLPGWQSLYTDFQFKIST